MEQYNLIELAQQGAHLEVNSLTEAVLLDDTAAIAWFLTHGSKINQSDAHGITPLMLAIDNHKNRAMELLLQNGASVEQCDFQGRNALFHAIDSINKPAFFAVLERMSMLEGVDASYEGIATHIVRKGDLEMLRAFLSKTKHVNSIGKDSGSALQSAVLIGKYSMAQELLNRNTELVRKHFLAMGAECLLLSPDNLTRSYRLLKQYHGRGIGALMPVGLLVSVLFGSVSAALYVGSSIVGISPILGIAGISASAAATFFLLQADYLLKLNSRAWSIAGLRKILANCGAACTSGTNRELRALAKLVLTEGTFVDGTDSDYNTALMIAVKNGRFDIAKQLLDHGALVELGDRSATTPLMHACRNPDGHKFMSELIIRGARINRQDSRGMTPLMHAAEKGNLENVKALFAKAERLARASVDTYSRDSDGRTAERIALENGHEEVAKAIHSWEVQHRKIPIFKAFKGFRRPRMKSQPGHSLRLPAVL